jgi:hypothetical protein
MWVKRVPADVRTVFTAQQITFHQAPAITSNETGALKATLRKMPVLKWHYLQAFEARPVSGNALLGGGSHCGYLGPNDAVVKSWR